ncbi:MAG: helix-turn-helix domain-containing protein [Burkholderiales bacterium]|nr:helix-turn-helix domain-containing protein [Burkholderiales bacterium]
MMLLWSLDETARQLGGLSRRTVQRLISRGELPFLRVGRLVRIPADAVHEYVAARIKTADNQKGVEPVAWKGVAPCHLNAKIHRSSMSATPTQAAQELNVLLERLTKARRKR